MAYKSIVNKKIMVSGDWHGVWGPVNGLVNRYKPEIILQCGDFGWWPKFHNTTAIYSGEYEDISDQIVDDPWQRAMAKRVHKPWDQFGIKAKDTKIYWCDGNHEDHWDLISERNYMKAPCEMMPNVYYMKRGSVLRLPDGRNVLFMGGADSTDKDARMLGVDWFPEELINYRDVENLPDIKIDIVISHTCPNEIYEEIIRRSWIERLPDPSTHALSYVLNKYKPSLWYFGHFHLFMRGTIFETKWFCLNTLGQVNWWVYLED